MFLLNLSPQHLGAHRSRSILPCNRASRIANVRLCRVRSASSDNGSEPNHHSNGSRPHLPLSMYKRLDNLPYEGRTLTFTEASCDPYEELCKTPLHVWEAKCERCHGTGSRRNGSTRRRGGSHGHSTLLVCTVCSGLGYVRIISATPNEEEMNPDYTIGRQEAPPGSDKPKTRIRMW